MLCLCLFAFACLEWRPCTSPLPLLPASAPCPLPACTAFSHSSPATCALLSSSLLSACHHSLFLASTAFAFSLSLPPLSLSLCHPLFLCLLPRHNCALFPRCCCHHATTARARFALACALLPAMPAYLPPFPFLSIFPLFKKLVKAFCGSRSGFAAGLLPLSFSRLAHSFSLSLSLSIHSFMTRQAVERRRQAANGPIRKLSHLISYLTIILTPLMVTAVIYIHRAAWRKSSRY